MSNKYSAYQYASLSKRRACLSHDLHSNTINVVDIIPELERSFQLTVPDEVPFYTLGALVRYVLHSRVVAAA